MPDRRRRMRVLWSVLLAIAVLGVLFGWRYVAFNLWVEKDALLLEPYPEVIFEDNPASASELTLEVHAKSGEEKDEAVLRSLGFGRLVVHMSRSEFRTSIPARSCWVKVFLRTRHPRDPDVVQPIKLLAKLERRDGSWRVVRSTQLTLP